VQTAHHHSKVSRFIRDTHGVRGICTTPVEQQRADREEDGSELDTLWPLTGVCTQCVPLVGEEECSSYDDRGRE
jgi:hypothetical protein